MSLHKLEPTSQRTLWRDNGGNLLAVLVGLILIAGAAVIAYRQHRFVPPRFPPERSIQRPDPNLDPSVTGASGAVAGGLRIEVTGAANDSGSVMLALYGSAETFNDPEHAELIGSIEVEDDIAKWYIPAEELPDQIAIAAFHDENDDQMLNRNALGVPTERYGFSNNARGIVGPPRFEEAAIEGPFEDQTLNIVIR